MPADQTEQEQQLVLLEDEVFDFDDLRRELHQEPQQKDAAVATAAAAQLGDSTASREARDTREMIASMLDHQPLMSVDTTPSAYLEYLRVILNCTRLLRQPAMPADLRLSVAALLAKAKSLFCANAFSLIVQTVNAVGASLGDGPPVPAFWGETFSQHECQLWMELIETVFYFWAHPDPRARQRDDIVVEAFAVGLLDRLGGLRAAYAGGPARPDEAHECGRRAEQLAGDIRRRLRPRHLLALAHVKKLEKSLQPALAAFNCFLEAAEALPVAAAAPSPVSLGRTKAALDGVTFEQMRSALRLHRPGHFGACLPRMQRLRQRHLNRLELQQLRRCPRPRDLLGAAAVCAKDPELADFLAAFVEYASTASEFELQWQRSVVRDSAAMAPFLLGRLSRLMTISIDRAKNAGCWDSLSESLQSDLQRQSERRLSVLTEARPEVGQSDSPDEAPGGGSGLVTFELNLVVCKSPEFCPQFVLPETPAGTATAASLQSRGC